ncbi:hypothetical protein H4217_000765 [Coemansia sp. RSA 1939]|nr:hypothetical protein H4217_000765 [Coemansia sp. RSA 1939]
MVSASELNSAPAEQVSASINASAEQINALCDKIEDIASYVVSIKNDQSQEHSSSDTRQSLLETVTSTFVHLRQLNRKLHEAKVALNAQVVSLKRKTDDLGLYVENRKREMAYIQRDIDSTKKMETIYQTIDIIPEDEFRANAPEEFKTGNDTHHTLMLGRLRYEIRQREVLMESKAKAKEMRDSLRQDKRRRVEKLEKTDIRLQNYVKSLSQLGRSFGVVSDDEKNPSSGDTSGTVVEGSNRPKETEKFRDSRDVGSSRVGTPQM